MNYKNFAYDVLKKQNFRITKSRLAVIDVLSRARRTLNAYEIAHMINEQKVTIDISTIYRILTIYQKNRLVHFVKDKQGYIACKKWLCQKKNHSHHQFICQKCQTVTEIHLDDRTFLDICQKQLNSYQIKAHYFELTGLCADCV